MISLLALVLMFVSSGDAIANPRGMVKIPAGTYLPFILQATSKKGEPEVFRVVPVEVKAFDLDRRVVTNGDFGLFLKKNPDWRRSKIPSLFADEHYLGSWKSDLDFGDPGKKNKPVTQVSWFAAKAYCESINKTLPTTDQWEYALDDHGHGSGVMKEKILEWYSKPNNENLSDAGTDHANGFGLHDMVGLVWEWTLDFNAFMASDELRSGGSKDEGLFCGGGSLGKLSANDYAAFMRYSFRTSLKANYTTGNLGFRCAGEEK